MVAVPNFDERKKIMIHFVLQKLQVLWTGLKTEVLLLLSKKFTFLALEIEIWLIARKF